MIREWLTEWMPVVITRPVNVQAKDWRGKVAAKDGQLDHSVNARIVRVEISDPERVDDDGDPIKHSMFGIEHKVVSEKDSHVFLIKPNVTREYQWARRRFALQFEAWEGKATGKGSVATPLMAVGIIPEGIMPHLLNEGVSTVESLAHLTDQQIRKFGPNMLQYRQRALDYLQGNRTPPPAPAPEEQQEPAKRGRPKKAETAEAA